MAKVLASAKSLRELCLIISEGYKFCGMLLNISPIIKHCISIPASIPVHQIEIMSSTTYQQPLSPLDNLMPRFHIPIALILPLANGSEDHKTAIAHLQNSLSKAIIHLPYLAGRVTADSSNRGLLSIAWTTPPNDAGVQIEERAVPEGYPSYTKLIDTGAPSELFPFTLFPAIAPGQESKEEGVPVLRVVCTPIEGGLVVALGIHHCVFDGVAIGEFVRTWASVARGEDVSKVDVKEPGSRLPRISAGLGDELASKRTLNDILVKHREYNFSNGAGDVKKQHGDGQEPPTASSRIFHFPRDHIDRVKASLALTGGVEASALTVNNILCAFLWSRISHIRTSRPTNPQPASVSRLGFAVNGRRILGLTQPIYLGNVTLLAQTEQPMTTLSTAPDSTYSALAVVISAIATATRRVDKSHISDLVQLADLLPSFSSLAPGWDFVNGPDLSITSWTDLGLHDADFGNVVGKPTIVRTPFLPSDGSVVVLPRQRADPNEKIEVTVALREDDMKRLSEDEAWNAWCS